MLVTIEGSEGVGKSTLIENLKKQVDALYLREPGGTRTGEAIRACLKGEQLEVSCSPGDKTTRFLKKHYPLLSDDAAALTEDLIRGDTVQACDTILSPVDELVLFNAARVELMNQKIDPALSDGQTVILDRFTDSTLAYQGYGRGVDLDLVSSVCEAATSGRNPDLTLLMVIDRASRLKRMAGRGEPDRIEKSGYEFFERVDRGFDKISRLDRVRIVDASKTPGEVLEQALEAIRRARR